MSAKKNRKLKRKRERERLSKKKEAERNQAEEREIEKQETEEEKVLDSMAEEEEPFVKEYDSPVEAAYFAQGPTSFEDLDAEREASEKAHKVNSITYDAQDLMRNILHSIDLDPTEKADRIMDVAEDFADRVEAVTMEEPIQKDMDVLQIEALLATYERSLSPIEKAVNWADDNILKRKLSGKARRALQDSDFALPDKRKYPIHDASHVRNALARAAQQIEKGGEAAEDARKALPKIRKAAKKFGIEVSKDALIIEKDKNGDWRWVGKPSNNFIDHQGDIMSKGAHQEYVEYLTDHPDMAPMFLVWHTPGTQRVRKADGWLEHEGALIMSGKLTEDEATKLLKAQTQCEIGMSVGGVALREDPDNPHVITKYRLFEVSDLPRERAANPFTSLDTMMTKEVSMNQEDKIKYLSNFMGSEENAKAFLEKTGETQQAIAAAGVTSKEKVEEQPPVETEPVEKEQVPAATLETETLKEEILKAVGEEFDFEGLNAYLAKMQESQKENGDLKEKIAMLEDVVKELTADEEEKLAKELEPPASRFLWSRENRKSTSADNVIKEDSKDEEDQKLLKDTSKPHWFSELAGIAPVSE